MAPIGGFGLLSLETIHFTYITQVAWLLWQGMERVEKGKHTLMYLLQSFANSAVRFLLILFGSFTFSAFIIYSDCDSIVLHACTCSRNSCSLYGTVGLFGCFVSAVILKKVFPSGLESLLKHKVIMEYYPTLKRINTVLIACS